MPHGDEPRDRGPDGSPAAPAMDAVRLLKHLVLDPFGRMQLRAGLVRPFRRRRFHHFGSNSILDRPAWVIGPHKIDIGDSVVIHHGVWLAAEPPTHSRAGIAISVGNRVTVRPYCTISAAESIVLEDDVVIAAYSTVIDYDHTYASGLPNIFDNPLATAPIRIGRGTWVAERVAVLRGSDIGRFCIVAANSVVRGTVPDHSVVAGAPARVVGSTRHWFDGEAG